MTETPETAAPVATGATNPATPVSLDVGNATDDLSAATLAVLEALNPIAPDDVKPNRSTEFAAYVAHAVEEALIDAGWTAPTGTLAEWRCGRCGADRWVGWRAGPEHEGWPRKAQCVPCGHVQELPPTEASAEGWARRCGEMAKQANRYRAERDALLPRLAELTEQAGKLRSTEWLRTCASLPMDEWPPAPAYKGPMVPAAERDQLQAERDELQQRVRREHRKYAEAVREINRLQDALDECDCGGQDDEPPEQSILTVHLPDEVMPDD